MVRGVLGVGLGLVGSFAWLEPCDFVRDRGVRDLDATPLVVGSGVPDFPLGRAFATASAGDTDRGMPPRPVRVDSPTIGEPERPLRMAMGLAQRLEWPTAVPRLLSVFRKRTQTVSFCFSASTFFPRQLAGELLVPEVSEPQGLRADPTKMAPTMVRHAVISLFMFAVAGAAAEPGVARARASEPTRVGVRSSHEETSTSLASSRVTTAQPLGLVPCDKPPAPPGCFILRTPFPPKGVRGAKACELRSPGLTVTLSGGSSSDPVDIPILYSYFDGVDVTFDVDIRAALVAEGVRAGDSRTLVASASLACPKDTFEEAAEELPANQVLRTGSGTGRLVFPFNFFLLEEMTILADSIETLVEAVDNLEITVEGTDGSEEFLYGEGTDGSYSSGPHLYELDPSDEDTGGPGDMFGIVSDPEPAQRPEFDLPEFDPPTFPWGEGLTA